MSPPPWVRPMLATAADDLPDDDARWAFELKWDGVRAIVRIDAGRVEARSRNDRDVTVAYPELGRLTDLLPGGLLLDGEMVAFDAAGRPSFELLQSRMHISTAERATHLAAETPVRFLVFDLLFAAGRSLVGSPYAERRALLEALALDDPAATTSPAWQGGGADVLAASRAQHLEGIVAKRLDSAYEPGRRSRMWRKLKNIRTQEVVIGGWRPGNGRRAGAIGSLLVGVPGPAGLDYAGHVGTGFTERALADLGEQLAPLARDSSPFAVDLPTADRRDAHWVDPRLVGEAAFTVWTRDGRLRHPTWRGLRPDKNPGEVVRES